MLTILSDMFRTATKTDWDAPPHWRQKDSYFRQECEKQKWQRRLLAQRHMF